MIEWSRACTPSRICQAISVSAALLLAISAAFAQPAPPEPILLPVSTDAGCIIQSDFGSGSHKNFETVVLQGSDLVHYWHDNANVDYTWVRGQVITHQAASSGCIIQSDFRSGGHGNFEVVVREGHNLVHYWHDNSDVTSAWRRGQTISTAATGAATIIQSDFRSGTHGNFEVLVLEGTNLAHYWHDNSDVNSPWRRGQVISTAASSTATIIQSDFRSGAHGNFEVAVREGASLVHYWHDNSDVNSPWRRGQTISSSPGGPASMIQSDFRAGGHGNFELVTVEGGSLVHYWRDNSDVSTPWRRGQTVAAPASASAGLIQSDFRSGGHGNFEVVAYRDGHVYHYWHDNGNTGNPWRPGQVVSPSGRSQKVCQLTGEFDFQNRHETSNRTRSRFSVAGTDLGYPFVYDGRIYFAFGDTGGSVPDGRDSLAFTRESDPDACPLLEFVADGNTFRPVQAPGVSLAYFEVPTTGFSANGAMYLFVWTDHKDLFRKDAQGNEVFSNPVGHAALLRSDDAGRSFRLVWDRLGDKLVYLAVAVVDNADVPGLPDRSGKGLLIWGSGKFYRASNPYLAYLPLAQVEHKEAVRYFTGIDARTLQPRWGSEPDAQPLFTHPCVGELSVTWNRNLRRWLMLYNCDQPSGIVGRLAETPWGPWSVPAVLFDPAVDAGTCYFLHGGGDCGPPTDPDSPANGGPGGPYGPYVVSWYTRGGQQSTTVYYVMSTWNPYDAVLMRSTLAVHSPLPYGPDTCRQGFVWREA
ncbi:MAG TPA: DUF4185 domain-containing protein, partial [Burkholderiales bacterium]|nr:DUF4185 domain-containing protein [Burkholderiales bacterium]